MKRNLLFLIKLSVIVLITVPFVSMANPSQGFDSTTYVYLPYVINSDAQPSSPNVPSDPSPADGATDQSIDVDLSWTCGDPNGDTVTYDVYFEAGGTTPDALVSDNQSGTTYDPGTLLYDTQYYWQIIAEDDGGATTVGPVWSFTTQAYVPCAIDLSLDEPEVDGLTTTISGTVSSECSTITQLNWQWGDGSDDDQWFPASHTYTLSGNYTITATAHNDLGGTEVQTTTVDVTSLLDGMVLIPAEEFQMGCDPAHNGGDTYCPPNELPLHAVYLDVFQIDTYEVTNAQYAAFLNGRGNNTCNGTDCVLLASGDSHISYSGSVYVVDTGYEDHPVNVVTWYGSESYCSENGKRLPTEAEWEKAARGTTIQAYPWGDASPNCSLTNYLLSPPDTYCVGDTMPVGSYPSGASPYGALDMAGNVYEWVNDWFLADYYDTSPYSNPTGPETGTYKVERGGYWGNSYFTVRVASRARIEPATNLGSTGFRCAADAP